MLLRRYQIALIAACLLAAGLRLGRLNAESLWADEASTWRVTRATLAEFNHTLLTTEVAPPLYFFLMLGWTRLAGTSEIALRLPSALCGILAVAALGVLVRGLLGRQSGLAAALLLAAAPLHIWYSQESRPYAAFTLLIVLSTWALIRAWRSRRAAAWMGYGVFTLAACYTHYFAAYFVAAQALLVAIQVLLSRAEGRSTPWRWWLACLAVVAVLWLPWVPSFLRTPWGYVAWIEGHWAGVSPLAQLWQTVRELLFGRSFPRLTPEANAALALVAGLAVWGLLAARRTARAGPFPLVGLALCPLLAAWGVSQFKASLLPRYVLPVLPFLLALAAWAAASLRPRWLRWLATGLLLTNQLWLVGRGWTHPTRPDWRGLSQHIAAHMRAGDGAQVEHIFYVVSLDYYLSGKLPIVHSAADWRGLTRLWFVEVPGSGWGGKERLAGRYPVEEGPRFDGLDVLYLYDLRGVGPHYAVHD